MRIIAGKFKGTKLLTFDENNLIRPTTDKVREAVFSKIQFDLIGASFLDLFGGTGAVSLEAISRGASDVIICDHLRKSAELIKKNYIKCKVIPELLFGEFDKNISKLINCGKTFDFIYIDPPYKTNLGEKSLQLINENKLLAGSGVIIYEHLKELKFNMVLTNLEVFDSKNYGTISVEFLRWKNA